MGGPKSVACPQSLRCRRSQMEELLQPSVEAICMALFGIVERLSAAGMGAALEEAARGFEVFGELAEIGRVVLVAARALDGRRVLLGWRLAAERGARARHHALHGADQRGLDAAGAGCGHSGVSVCLSACVRLLIPLGAELVSELPRLGISALPVAAFELAEQISARRAYSRRRRRRSRGRTDIMKLIGRGSDSLNSTVYLSRALISLTA